MTELGIDAEDEPIEDPSRQRRTLTAYDAYLKARELYLARGKANVAESMRLFEHARWILDPNFARGWEGLAGVYAIATSWGILDRDYSAMSLVAAKRALEIDPGLVCALCGDRSDLSHALSNPMGGVDRQSYGTPLSARRQNH